MSTFQLGSIDFGSKLDRDKEMSVTYIDNYERETIEYIDREEAMELMEHLVKVFGFSSYEIGGLQ